MSNPFHGLSLDKLLERLSGMTRVELLALRALRRCCGLIFVWSAGGIAPTTPYTRGKGRSIEHSTCGTSTVETLARGASCPLPLAF